MSSSHNEKLGQCLLVSRQHLGEIQTTNDRSLATKAEELAESVEIQSRDPRFAQHNEDFKNTEGRRLHHNNKVAQLQTKIKEAELEIWALQTIKKENEIREIRFNEKRMDAALFTQQTKIKEAKEKRDAQQNAVQECETKLDKLKYKIRTQRVMYAEHQATLEKEIAEKRELQHVLKNFEDRILTKRDLEGLVKREARMMIKKRVCGPVDGSANNNKRQRTE